jgi:hypothetical protein
MDSIPKQQGKERTKTCHDFSPRRLERNRWARKRHRESKIAVLNALWHLAAPSSRPKRSSPRPKTR